MARTLAVVLQVGAVIVVLGAVVNGSAGDRSPVHQECLRNCFSSNCSSPEALDVFRANQPVGEFLLRWTCRDECRYQCMWKTIERFHEAGLNTPQFHGKWPFVRLLGVQEPASAFFSILNLMPHVFMIMKMRRTLSPEYPMYNVWMLYGLVSINTWSWSTVFHSRDTDLTEKLDYFSAFSVVTYSLLAFFIRVFGEFNRKSVISSATCIGLFAWHINNMTVHFDYGYNMLVNVSVGLFNSLCWIGWAIKNWRTHPSAKTAMTAVIALNASMVLELFDFPPLLWTFDSHALWHLSTAPIHILWWNFILQDCKILDEERRKSDVKKMI